MKLTAEFRPQTLIVHAGAQTFGIQTGEQIAREYVGAEPYEGEYAITPTTEEQIIPIRGMRAVEDFVIGAIPHNYGLITWNGSTLTVS